MPVLPYRSLVFAFPAQLFVCLRSNHGAILERSVVHRRCFALLWCTRLFLRLLPLFFALGALGEKNIYFAHVLRSADCRLHSLMSSLKIPVCDIRLIPFDTIIAPEIFWTPSLSNYLPFSNCSISRSRGSAGSYVPIILTAFSSRLIYSIAP